MSVTAQSRRQPTLLDRWHLSGQLWLTWLVPLMALILLLAAQSARLTAQRAPLTIPIDSRAANILLLGAHATEADQRGLFRWSNGHTQIVLHRAGSNTPALLALRLGPPPPALVGSNAELNLAGQTIAHWPVADQPRTYRFLVPATSGDQQALVLQSDTTTVPPDSRQVGLRIEAVGMLLPGATPIWPSLLQIVAQTILLLGAMAINLQLRLPLLGSSVGIFGIATGLFYASVAQPLLYTPYVLRLAIALLAVLAINSVVLPFALRHTRWFGPAWLVRLVWGATLLACAIRLVGSLYPLFRAYDLPLNVDRLLSVINGTLVASNESFEFGGGVTVYPAGPYVVLLPGIILGFAPQPLVQIGVAVIDSLSVIAVALLTRRLGLNDRVTALSALLTMAMPIALTSLYYGHSAQIFGQGLMAPLAIMLLSAFEQAQKRWWLFVGVILAMALLTHIGVAILAVSWLGLIWLLAVPTKQLRLQPWFWFSIVLAICGLVSILLVYGPVIGSHLMQAQRIGERAASGDRLPAYNLILKAYWISYTPLCLLLAAPGAFLLFRRMTPQARLVIGSWFGAAIGFALIEWVSGLQVRFLVFLTPLIAISVATLLHAIPGPRAARYAAAGITLATVLVLACAAWYNGTFLNIAPSMIPLLR